MPRKRERWKREMPEYRRFIAYFYEYIEGKRQRNAGFVKAEQRDGIWRISLQLKGRRWPENSLKIFGYCMEEEQYLVICLAKGYPQKDCMIQKIQLPADWTDPTGKQFEELDGMWIPCGKNRCFISHWGEGEAVPEKLEIAGAKENNSGIPVLPEKEKREPELPDRTETEEREPELPDRTETEEREPELPDRTEMEEREPELPDRTETEEKEPEVPDRTEMEEREPELPDRLETEEKEAAELEATECRMEEPQRLRREPQDCLDDMKRVVDISEKIQENGGKGFSSFEQENEAENGSEKKKTERSSTEKGSDTEKYCVWKMLKRYHPVLYPLRDGEEECIMICPRDVLWLRQQGWTVGRNSFLIQGFSQYRHLILCRKNDGRYLLGVPGKKNSQMQNTARAFGYGEFEQSGQEEDFGYWCRQV